MIIVTIQKHCINKKNYFLGAGARYTSYLDGSHDPIHHKHAHTHLVWSRYSTGCIITWYLPSDARQKRPDQELEKIVTGYA